MHTLIIFSLTIIGSALFAGDRVPPRLGKIPKASSDSNLPRKKLDNVSPMPTRASDADIPAAPVEVVARTRSPKVHAMRKKASSSEDPSSKVQKRDNKRKDNNFLSQAASVVTKKLAQKPGHIRKRSYSDTVPSTRAATTSNTTPKPYPLIKASSTGEVRKRVAFTTSPKQVRRTPQTQQVRQSLDDNKSTLIVIMKQRVPLKQHDYTYEEYLDWSNRNKQCIQLLIANKEEQKEKQVGAKNDKEGPVEWNMLPYIAFLHTLLEAIPFDMAALSPKVCYKDEWIYLKEVFPMLALTEKSFFEKKYTVKSHYNEDTNSFDLAVLNNKAACEEQVSKIKEEIADERRKVRREFFRDEKDILAKIEDGIKKKKEKNE